MRADRRKAAQQRVDRIALFKAELAELAQEDGLTLTPEQQSGLDLGAFAVTHVCAQTSHPLLGRFGAKGSDEEENTTHFSARVHWGNNYEPWVEEIRPDPVQTIKAYSYEASAFHP